MTKAFTHNDLPFKNRIEKCCQVLIEDLKKNPSQWQYQYAFGNNTEDLMFTRGNILNFNIVYNTKTKKVKLAGFGGAFVVVPEISETLIQYLDSLIKDNVIKALESGVAQITQGSSGIAVEDLPF